MERAVSLAKRRNLVFGWRNMARKKEVRVVLLAALIVTLGVGPVAARIVVTGRSGGGAEPKFLFESPD